MVKTVILDNNVDSTVVKLKTFLVNDFGMTDKDTHLEFGDQKIFITKSSSSIYIRLGSATLNEYVYISDSYNSFTCYYVPLKYLFFYVDTSGFAAAFLNHENVAYMVSSDSVGSGKREIAGVVKKVRLPDLLTTNKSADYLATNKIFIMDGYLAYPSETDWKLFDTPLHDNVKWMMGIGAKVSEGSVFTIGGEEWVLVTRNTYAYGIQNLCIRNI